MLIKFWVTLTIACNAYVCRSEQASFRGGRAWRQSQFSPARRQEDTTELPVNLENTYFCPVSTMEQTGAFKRKKDNFIEKMTGRVIHALWNDTHVWAPLICTAAMVKFAVFLTAARCIATAKVEYTTVVFRNERLPTKAFILPTRTSKQMFDDLGFIVTYYPKNTKFEGVFIRTYELRPEESSSFDWFDNNMRRYTGNVSVAGYLASEHSPSTHYLYQLNNMHASTDICNKLYPAEENSTDYRVPCVHSCSLEQHRSNDSSCKRYMFGLGHIVFLHKKTYIIGIVTWTCGNHATDRARRGPLPVGIAAVTESRLFDDMTCAVKIAVKDKAYSPEIVHKKPPDYYKNLCEIGKATRGPWENHKKKYESVYG